MTIISTEMLKWKRNKTVLGIFILTAILGIFAVERAFSISRSSSLMNSFSDLYTLAFKNLTSLFLPIVLSMFATTLFFDEQKNDTLKGLLIIPISKTQLYFSKIAVVIFMSLALCLLTFAICILGGFLAGGFTDLNTETILQAGLLFLAGGVLVPLAMLPVIFLATLAKGYVLPIGAALLYLVPVVLIPSGIMGLHPLASVMGIYPYISSDAAEMVKKWAGGIEITISPNICLISLLVIGSISAIVSVLALSIKMILSFFKIYLLDGIGIFFAIAPVIAVVSRIKKGYWLALIFTVIYSFSKICPIQKVRR